MDKKSYFKFLIWTFYVVEILFAFMYDRTAFFVAEIFGGRPVFLISVFIVIMLLEKKNTALVFAAIIGVFSDVQIGDLIGLQVILFMTLAVILNSLANKFKKSEKLLIFLAEVLIVPVVILFRFLSFFVLNNYHENFYAFWKYLLLNVIYTMLVTPIVYLISNKTTLLLKKGEYD
ncbi:hypothetical protein FACS189465_0570 [Clostridia bacterium]|nr:hypothetical protein FACS189465_0570 [Clostridia bacterium]